MAESFTCRERWEKQDRRPDLYDAITVSPTRRKADLLPIIDLDMIGPDDFRNIHKEDVDFALWIKHGVSVDEPAQSNGGNSKDSRY